MCKEKQTLAQRLRKLRLEKGLTQKELASELSLGYGTVVGYENGKREPNSKAMAALEQYFNVSGVYLRGETDILLHSYEENWKGNEELPIDHNNVSLVCSAIAKSAVECNEFEQKMLWDILVELRHILNMTNKQFGVNNTDARAVTLGLLQKMIWFLNSYADRIIFTVNPQEVNRVDAIVQDTVESIKSVLKEAAISDYPSSLTSDEMFSKKAVSDKQSKTTLSYVARGGQTGAVEVDADVLESLKNLEGDEIDF